MSESSEPSRVDQLSYTGRMVTSRKLCRVLGFSGLVLLLTGCPRDKTNGDDFTLGDASQALEESAVDSQAQALSSDVVEITTSFIIGDAAEAAAQELHDFVASQLPCATLSLAGATLGIDYGSRSAGCLYHGHPITGESSVTIVHNDATDVVIEHTWTGLSNGVVQIDGSAIVTYTRTDPSRHVEHQVVITRLSDGYTLEGEGDRIQKPLAEGLATGFEVNGTRGWTSPRGSSTLEIEGVQMRWIDPVPQAGIYRLTTPKNREITLSFTRKDTDTISVALAGGSRTFRFDVSKAGTTKRTE